VAGGRGERGPPRARRRVGARRRARDRGRALRRDGARRHAARRPRRQRAQPPTAPRARRGAPRRRPPALRSGADGYATDRTVRCRCPPRARSSSATAAARPGPTIVPGTWCGHGVVPRPPGAPCAPFEREYRERGGAVIREYREPTAPSRASSATSRTEPCASTGTPRGAPFANTCATTAPHPRRGAGRARRSRRRRPARSIPWSAHRALAGRPTRRGPRRRAPRARVTAS
jgi:hypothetical protein